MAKVLVLDENADTTKFLEVFLRHRGDTLLKAQSVAEALKLFDANTNDIALVIAEASLAGNPTAGIDFLRTIHAIKPSMKIALHADRGKEIRQEMPNIGIQVIPKAADDRFTQIENLLSPAADPFAAKRADWGTSSQGHKGKAEIS